MIPIVQMMRMRFMLLNLCSIQSLKPVLVQEELKFTFDVSKCDRIFDELLKLGNIKISHTMPPLDEIK
jgi:hypothetical protein